MTKSSPIPLVTPGGISQPKRFSLAESIADSIAGAIATRHLKPGERVVELTLAEQLGVSRVPVREALKVLHAQGIISGGSHRGYRVVAFDEQTAQNVFELRLTLEKILLRDAIVRFRAGEADLSGLHAAVNQMKMAARIEDRAASLAADLEFHRAICESAGNEIAATLWETLARHVLIIFSREDFRDDDLDSIVAQHSEFLDYITDCVERPTAPTEKELERALNDHLLQVMRARKKKRAEVGEKAAGGKG